MENRPYGGNTRPDVLDDVVRRPNCQKHRDPAALSIQSKNRFYFAVYVRQRTWITPCYMGLIDPFRKWIIHPAMLKTIRVTCDQNI